MHLCVLSHNVNLNVVNVDLIKVLTVVWNVASVNSCSTHEEFVVVWMGEVVNQCNIHKSSSYLNI